jgi:protein-S-isoprenylcysteine O-methyltransferase Ste14
MAEQVYLVAAVIVLAGSYLRGIAAAVVGVRTFLSRSRFRRLEMGLSEAVIAPEPLVLLAVTSLTLVFWFDPDGASAIDAIAAAVGAALVLYAWNLTAWSFLSWRSIFFGHGIQEDQELVTGGAYSLVRHPVYLGVMLIWIGLSVAFLSPVVAIITGAYVVPFYLLYVLSEERMMREEFGDVYRAYCARVPMFLPYARLILPPRPATDQP